MCIRDRDYGEKIILEYNSSIGVRQTIKELDGNWVRIKAKEHIGYVFDTYLSELPIVSLDSDSDSDCTSSYFQSI